jgi:hypothetical protein
LPKELIEPVCRWQVFVAVAEMILAELAGGIAVSFQHIRNGWILRAEPKLRAGQADLGETGADR